MRYGLIGGRLSHSFSASIHTQFGEYPYELKELSLNELSAFLEDASFDGINVTAPFKELVLPYLDVVDKRTSSIGSVNTIVRVDGKLHGYNTDYDGLLEMLQHYGVSLKSKRILILGSGGTAKTAMAVSRQCGCSSVNCVSRTAKAGCVSYEEAKNRCADTQIIINTTPSGMAPLYNASPLCLDDYAQLEWVVDVIYNPLRSKLVCDALERGIPAVGGLFMLVAQAAKASELFTGRTVSHDQVITVYNQLHQDMQNIVLVGMPGCGKSTVGKEVATLLNREFIDTDTLIADLHDASPATMINTIGEAAFRRHESAVIQSLRSKQGVVIATGGGAVLSQENRVALRQNGRIYFLDRSLRNLPIGGDRPLSSNQADMETMYLLRCPMYNSIADVCISSDCAVSEIANTIREDFFNESFRD